jgi:hypothetical protein
MNRNPSGLATLLIGVVVGLPGNASAGEAWHRLSSVQLQRIVSGLAPTHIRPLAPAYLPAGFRLIRAEVDVGSVYFNGEIDGGYTLSYAGPNDQCFELTGTKAGPRGMKKIGSVRSAIGSVAIYSDSDPNLAAPWRNSLSSFLGSILLHTPSYPSAADNRESPSCKPITLEEFRKVAASLRLLPKK